MLLSTEETTAIDEIVTYARELIVSERRDGGNFEKILCDKITEKYGIYFALAREVDRKLVGTSGGFWRESYGWPKLWDVIREDDDGGKVIVTSCGLFTFEMEVLKK